GIRDFHVTGVQTCALPISAGEVGQREPALAHELSADAQVAAHTPALRRVVRRALPEPEVLPDQWGKDRVHRVGRRVVGCVLFGWIGRLLPARRVFHRSEEHTSELQSRENLVCRLLLEKKKEMRYLYL